MRECPDGQLSMDKLRQVYSQIYPDGDPSEFCVHAFRSFDKDNSGSIDFKEFLLALSARTSGNPKEKLDWAFSLYDIDGNGSIDRNEFETIIKSMNKMRQYALPDVDIERATKIFNKIDVNGDGVMSKEEFVHACMTEKGLYQMLFD